MKQVCFIKNVFIEKFASSLRLFEDAESLLHELTNKESISKGIIYNFLNRQEYLKDIFEALNSPEIKLILVSGFQGTGKTELLKSAALAIEDNVLNFNYTCSSITNLDDLILSIYGYLYRNIGKEADNQRTIKLTGSQSIDERLINYLKNLKRPLLLSIDSFEYLLQENLTIADEELSRFLNYIISLPMIKLIVSGKRIPSSAFKLSESNILSIRLGGLSEQDAVDLLRNYNIPGSDHTLYQAYQMTRGYPESLLWFIAGIKAFNSSAFDIIKEYSTHRESFEEYISDRIYNSLSQNLKELVWILSVIRHPVSYKSLEKLSLIDNIDESLQLLKSRMIIAQNNDSYYIKSFLRKNIYNSIAPNEKVRIHKYLHELYTEQITKKLEDRILGISRKLLHSEQYYHFVCLSKLEKEYNLKNRKSNISSFARNNQDLSYLPSHMVEAIVWSGNNTNDNSQNNTEKKPDEISNFENVSGNVELQGFDFDPEIAIDLTDEEKALLQDEKPIVESLQISNSLNVKRNEYEDHEKSADELIKQFIQSAKTFELSQKLDLALENYKKAFSLIQNDKKGQAIVSKSIGNVLHSMHKYDESIEYLNQSLQIYSDLNDKANINLITLNIANVYNDCYKHDIALQNYYQILKSGKEGNQAEVRLEALSGIADIYDYRENLDGALKYSLEALDLAEVIGELASKSKLCFKIALIYDDLNDFDSALVYYRKNIAIQDNRINQYRSSSYANMAAIFEEFNDKVAAINNYIESLNVDKQTNNYEGQYKTLSRLGSIYFELGDVNKASEYYHEEIAVAKLSQDPYWIAMSYLDIGDFYLAQKLYEKAVKSFIKARKSIGSTISTDSKEKIDRRFKNIVSEIGETDFYSIVNNIKKKNG